MLCTARRAARYGAASSWLRGRVGPGAGLGADDPSGEERQLGLALAAQQREVDLDALDPARRREGLGLPLDRRRGEDAAAGCARRVEADALEIAAELLDGVDGRESLHLDGHPAAVGVAAHQVDGAEVGRPLAPFDPEPVAEHLRPGGERLLEIALEAVLAPPGALADDEHAVRFLDDRRRRHPVQRLVAAGVRVDEHRAVGLEHQEPRRLRQVRGQPTGVRDLAARDDQAHRAAPYCPFRTVMRARLPAGKHDKKGERMRWQAMRTAAAVAIVALAVAAAQAAAAGSAAVRVIATGLNNPRGVAVAPDGSVLVAQAGAAGKVKCFKTPEGDQCAGFTGSIDRVANGTRTRYGAGFFSGGNRDGSFSVGMDGVTVSPGGAVYGIESTPGLHPAQFGPQVAAQAGYVLRVDRSGKSAVGDNVTAYEVKNNPAGDN